MANNAHSPIFHHFSCPISRIFPFSNMCMEEQECPYITNYTCIIFLLYPVVPAGGGLCSFPICRAPVPSVARANFNLKNKSRGVISLRVPRVRMINVHQCFWYTIQLSQSPTS
jgi:hypothetical protein